MKIFFTLLLVIIYTNSYSQYRKFTAPIWTIGTANTIKKHDLHLNALYYSQYGITDKIELQTKPLWWYKFPNLAVKIKWWNKASRPGKTFFEKQGMIFSSKHGIYYPTPLMNYVSAKSIKNINFGSNISGILVFKNEALLSILVKKNKGCYSSFKIFTLKIGNQTAILNKSSDYILSNNSLLYRETSMFGDKSLWYVGLDYDNKLSYGLNYSFDIDFYSIGFDMSSYIIEHKGIVYWYWGYRHRIRPALGYQLSFTNHPNVPLGFYPLFDISYLFSVKKSKKNGNLFDNGVIEDTDMGNLYNNKN